MDLKDDLLRGIYAYGFEKPSAIQQRAILPCIRGNFLKCFMLIISFRFLQLFFFCKIKLRAKLILVAI